MQKPMGRRSVALYRFIVAGTKCLQVLIESSGLLAPGLYPRRSVI
jgi:hypothetical protein